MLNIRRLTLLTFVAFIATITYAQPTGDASAATHNINSFETDDVIERTQKCTAVIKEYDISECLVEPNSLYGPYKDVEELKTVCSRHDRCNNDRFKAGIDAFEKDCEYFLRTVDFSVRSAYNSWCDLPYRYVVQCTKVGDKYCATEYFTGMICTKCQHEMAVTLFNFKFDRVPVYNSTSAEVSLKMKAKHAIEACVGVDVDNLDEDTDEDGVYFGVDINEDDKKDGNWVNKIIDRIGSKNSATSLHINILGISLVALSTIMLSQ
jgi:hypothetical protein